MSIEQRIEKLPDVFMLASGIVQLKYVQDIGNLNEANFKVGMAGGHVAHGTPEQYQPFLEKYLAWLETR